MAGGTYERWMRAEPKEDDPLAPQFLRDFRNDSRFEIFRALREGGKISNRREAIAVASIAMRRVADFHDQLGLPVPVLHDDRQLSTEMSRQRFYDILKSGGFADRLPSTAKRLFDAFERTGVYVLVPKHRGGGMKGAAKVESIRVLLDDVGEHFGARLPAALMRELRTPQQRYLKKRKSPTPPRRRAGQ